MTFLIRTSIRSHAWLELPTLASPIRAYRCSVFKSGVVGEHLRIFISKTVCWDKLTHSMLPPWGYAICSTMNNPRPKFVRLDSLG